MKLAVLFSGGKDSNYALYLASKENEISCLINMKSRNEESYMFQSAGNNIINLQSHALNIPLVQENTNGKKEKELLDLKKAIKKAIEKYKIKGIVTGAIKSAYQSSRIQKICDELNIYCFNPIWQINEENFLDDLIDNKFEVKIIGIFSYPLSKENLNTTIDKKFKDEILKLSKKHKISPAGEGGEYESFVLDSPLFKKKIKIIKHEIIEESENSAYMKIKKAILIEK
jgi:diphthine-ammonia ligase